MTVISSELHGHWRLPEQYLSFDPTDAHQVAVNPLIGLRDFGPFSSRLSASYGDKLKIKIALLAPANDLQRLRDHLNELARPQDPKERYSYLPKWPGFEAVFRIRLAPADDSAQIPLLATLDEDLRTVSNPRQHLADVLIEGLRKLALVRDRFDVVVFYLPHRFQPLFEDKDTDFDLHDFIKAFAAQLGLTTQIVTDGAMTYRCRASVAWRLGAALYAKAGWIPWKLDTKHLPLDVNSAYIGLSYALRTIAGGTKVFVTCCSQVFDADGGGMEFVAYEVGQGTDTRNPYLSREDMRLVMARSLALYQDRHAGRSPRELVVHKQTPFQPQEVAGCSDAWGATSNLSCINITRSPWRGVAIDAPKMVGSKGVPGYALPRGTAFQLDDRSVLLWIGGNAPGATLTGEDNFFQGGKGIPQPLLLTRDAGAGPLDYVAAQILGLSKMDWNNDALYDGLPCTIQYAKVLAKTIKHMPNLAPQPYDYRFFM